MASPEAQLLPRRVLQRARRPLRGRLRRSSAAPARRDDAVFLVARLRGEPVGCGAIKVGHEATIKRMWIAPSARGLGLGRRMLARARAAREHARRPPGDQPHADRGDRALPRRGLRRGRAVQRRAVRPPLVREAPLNILPPHARDRPLPDLQGLRRPRPVRRRHRRRHRRGGRPRPRPRARGPLRQAGERAQGRPGARHAPVGAGARRPLPRRAGRRGRARRRRRHGRHRDGLLAGRLARPRRRPDVHRQPQPEGLHGREDGRARLRRALRRPRTGGGPRPHRERPRRGARRRLLRGGRHLRGLPARGAEGHRPERDQAAEGRRSTAATAWRARWSARSWSSCRSS